MAKVKTNDLTGKLLVAMPGMGDPRFEHSVIYMCAHSGDGSMGLIVNKPTPDLSLHGLLRQLDIPPTKKCQQIRVHFGGPVEHGRGFVLHSTDYLSNDATLKVDAQFGMTATLDVLKLIAQGSGPKSCIMALGYAGWGPGQLDAEILRNGWLIAEASPEVVFEAKDAQKWTAALKGMGIDPLMLSSTAGRA